MPSRRETLLVGSSVLISTLAGCLRAPGSTAPLLEVRIDLNNSSDETQTFHLALETEDGLHSWESYTVPGGTNETVVLDPPENSTPTALHGVIGEFADDIQFVGLNNVDDDFCLNMVFWYDGPSARGTMIAQSSDIRC